METDPPPGRYVPEGEIARGGMGVILRVRDRNLDRTLAMKRMLAAPEADGSDLQEMQYIRFLEEAQITSHLDHPSIVPIHELGSDDQGRVYYTMRLVKGREFGEIIRDLHTGRPGASENDGAGAGESARATWTLPRVLGVMVRVCQAVAFAHGKGVIHRDLKPANIMVGNLGEVYVMDWGLARMAGRDDVHDIRLQLEDTGLGGLETIALGRAADDTGAPPLMTMDGAVIGTPAYMPPEQAAGRVSEVDQASDIYALGAVLYEALTGQPPYMPTGGNTTPKQVLTAVQKQPPERIRRVNAAASPELAAICEKAMARAPGDRYATCLDLAEDLQAYLDQRVVRAYRTGPLVEFSKWVQRNRAVAAAGAVAVAALIASAALQSRSARIERAARLEAVTTLADSYVAIGLRAAKESAFGNAQLWFSEAARLASEDPAREHANRIRAQAHGRRVAPPVRAFYFPGIDFSELSFGPNQRYLLARGKEGCRVLDLEKEIEPALGPAVIHSAAWHPDGGRLALFRDSGAVEIRRLPDLAIEDSFSLGDSGGPLLAYSADGRWLLAGGTRARLWDAHSKRLAGQVPGFKDGPASAAFSPDGRLLLAGEDDAIHLYHLDPDGSAEPAMDPIGRPNASKGVAPQFVGDGSQFVIPSDWNEFEVWDASVLKPISKWRFVAARPLGEAERIAGSGAGGDEAFLTDGRIDPTKIALDPFGADGTYFARRDEWTDMQFRGRDGAPLDIIGHRSAPALARALSNDCRLAATAQRGGLITVWALPDPPRSAFFKSGAPAHGVFSPDSRLFALAGTAALHDRSGKAPTLRQSRVFAAATGEPAGPPLDCQGSIITAEFPAGGETIVLACNPQQRRTGEVMLLPDGRSGNLQVWNWRTGTRLHPPIPLPSEPRVVRRHPDDGSMAVLCAGNQLLRLDPLAGEVTELARLPGKSNPGSWGPVDHGDLRFTAEGDVLVAWNISDFIHVRNWPQGTPRLPVFPPPTGCKGIRIHGRILGLTANAYHPETPSFFNLDTGEPEASGIRYHGSELTLCGRFSRDGELFLLSGLTSGTRVWHWRTGEPACPDLPTTAWTRAEFIPGTPWIITTNDDKEDDRIQFWDRHSGKPVAPGYRPSVPAVIQGLHLSPDGKFGLASDSASPPGLHLLDLGHLHGLEHAGLSLEDRMRLARLNAGSRPHEGGLVQLGHAEFMQEWKAFRQRHPGFHQLNPPPAGRARWHDRRAARLDGIDDQAAAWHRARARELGERE